MNVDELKKLHNEYYQVLLNDRVNTGDTDAEIEWYLAFEHACSLMKGAIEKMSTDLEELGYTKDDISEIILQVKEQYK